MRVYESHADLWYGWLSRRSTDEYPFPVAVHTYRRATSSALRNKKLRAPMLDENKGVLFGFTPTTTTWVKSCHTTGGMADWSPVFSDTLIGW